MIAQVAHRGPDDRGVHISGSIGLAHSRLSVIDLVGGSQPMSNQAGTISISYNGEVFNYRELRKELIGRGHQFVSQSDTEVILHAYEEYGEDCVHHFNGQWAFVLWDGRRQRLFASRDRFGIQPLFYSNTGDSLLFGSEVKSILAHGGVRPALDLEALGQIFSLWCTVPPKTAFENVLELPPGHNMIIERGVPRIVRYWVVDHNLNSESESVDDCAAHLKDLLLDAVRLRLRADVPLGVYLSGGLDSTVVAGAVREVTESAPRSYSVTFEDSEFDESAFQRESSIFLGTRHREIRCTADHICGVFPEVIWHAEKPILRTAPAPLFMLSKFVRDQGEKVVLTGEGADEMLGGYDIFKEAKIRRFWASNLDSGCRPLLLKRLYPYLPALQAQSPSYLQGFFKTTAENLTNPFFSHLPRWESGQKNWIFFTKEVQDAIAEYDPVNAVCEFMEPADLRCDDFLRAQIIESMILLPGYILSSQGDRMLLAHGLEGRFPFLDHRVAEFALQLPAKMKMRVLNEKEILKRSASGLAPPSVLNRPKQPYRSPDSVSFFKAGSPRDEWVASLLASDRIKADGIFDPKPVSKLIEKAERGSAIGARDNMALVGILSTQLLIEQFIRNFDGAAG